MKINTLLSNIYNYDTKKRSIRNIRAIALHFTANNGDSSLNNARYFHNNIVGASAHFFVDREGVIYRSVHINRTAWAVESKGMKLKGIWNNANTISIELCDFYKNKEISDAQMKALKYLIKRIQRNVYLHGGHKLELIRHYDVCGKACPINLVDEKKWAEFKKEVLK